MRFLPALYCAAIAALLSACGGSSETATASEPVSPPVDPVTPPLGTAGAPPDWYTLLNHCAAPRTGIAPSGFRYPDVQGTLTDELKWLRSYFGETYLWYREIPSLNLANYSNALDYFANLKTFAITTSGRPKDRFHFTYPSDKWDAMNSAGVQLSYGLVWLRNSDASLSRILTVAVVEPGSSAAQVGMQRGDRLFSVDTVRVADPGSVAVATVNAALAPVAEGETHQLAWLRDGVLMQGTVVAHKLALPPVRMTKVLDTPTGKVGYLYFNEHNAVAESQLVSAFNTFKAAGVSDLVLDMRYNGGGLLTIASELAYMIAGPGATDGKVFEQPIYNDKTKPQPPMLFQNKAVGYPAATPVAAGTALPYLGLQRVTILTAAGTCSASESVINSLRGVDVEVNLIGGDTCGKPYAFTPAPNCGTTYFAIQLQGVNNKDYGDYADGFAPTCRVADDLSHPLGDPDEGQFAAALNYRANGICPVQAREFRASPAVSMQPLRPEVKEIAIRDR